MLSEGGEGEEILYAEIGMWLSLFYGVDLGNKDTDPSVMEETRAGIPVTVQRRFDVYKDVAA